MDVFKKIIKLRFLKFNGSESCNACLPLSIESLPDNLIYLHWNIYPLKLLPSTFCIEKLVEIPMPNSHVEKPWDGVQVFME